MAKSMKKTLTYPPLPYCRVSITLSPEAQDYLSRTTDGTSHCAILDQLIRDTVVTPTTISKRGNVIQLQVGQVECSVNSFSQKMSLGRKAMERIIRDFEILGLIRLQRSRLATIADMLCVSSWQLHDGTLLTNDRAPVQKDLVYAKKMPKKGDNTCASVVVDDCGIEPQNQLEKLSTMSPVSTEKSPSVSAVKTTSPEKKLTDCIQPSHSSSGNSSLTDILREVQGVSSGGNMGIFNILKAPG